MKISILLRTQEYRGDHAADIMIAHELAESETVEELVERLKVAKTDVVELRVVEEVKP